MFVSNILFSNQFEFFMKRDFTTATRVFELFADVFDLNDIYTKLFHGNLPRPQRSILMLLFNHYSTFGALQNF